MRLKMAAAMELFFRYGRRGGLAYPFVLLHRYPGKWVKISIVGAVSV
jgi:hypothetical protein